METTGNFSLYLRALGKVAVQLPLALDSGCTNQSIYQITSGTNIYLQYLKARQVTVDTVSILRHHFNSAISNQKENHVQIKFKSTISMFRVFALQQNSNLPPAQSVQLNIQLRFFAQSLTKMTNVMKCSIKTIVFCEHFIRFLLILRHQNKNKIEYFPVCYYQKSQVKGAVVAVIMSLLKTFFIINLVENSLWRVFQSKSNFLFVVAFALFVLCFSFCVLRVLLKCAQNTIELTFKSAWLFLYLRQKPKG